MPQPKQGVVLVQDESDNADRHIAKLRIQNIVIGKNQAAWNKEHKISPEW